MLVSNFKSASFIGSQYAAKSYELLWKKGNPPPMSSTLGLSPIHFASSYRGTVSSIAFDIIVESVKFDPAWKQNPSKFRPKSKINQRSSGTEDIGVPNFKDKLNSAFPLASVKTHMLSLAFSQ